jgi:hypothetical protein
MAGNYGGNSIPTTPVGGNLITTAAYANYKCTSAYMTTATGVFTYNGNIFNFGAVGDSVEFLMDATGISATDAKVIFLCYECDPCDGPITGITTSDYYSGHTSINHPTIIGGAGLNN